MEVNKSEAITPTSGGGKRSLDRHLTDDQEDNDKPDDEQPRRDAFEVDGELGGSISPKVQQMLGDLAAQLEPLRADLQRSQARERELRDRRTSPISPGFEPTRVRARTGPCCRSYSGPWQCGFCLYLCHQC